MNMYIIKKAMIVKPPAPWAPQEALIKLITLSAEQEPNNDANIKHMKMNKEKNNKILKAAQSMLPIHPPARSTENY